MEGVDLTSLLFNSRVYGDLRAAPAAEVIRIDGVIWYGSDTRTNWLTTSRLIVLYRCGSMGQAVHIEMNRKTI